MNNIKIDGDMFVIPTHRNCEKSVSSILEEMKEIKSNRYKFLVVVDNSKKEIYEQNHAFLKSILDGIEFPIYHVGLEQMDGIINQIAHGLGKNAKRLKELLLPDSIDYAKIYNMIYILTVALGVNRFHRRDSDCYYDESIKKLKYAVNSEEKYLGVPINQVVNQIKIIEQHKYKKDEEICIVGSDYLGNWNLDLEELMQSSDKIARRLLEVCDIPEDGIQKQLQEIYTSNMKVQECASVLKNTFQVTKVPECGNMAMTEVFRYLPNILGKNGMGFDYFTYFIAFLYKVPIIFHYHPILHIHDSRRYLDIDIVKYWIGILKMVDLDIIYTTIIKNGLISDLIKKESGLEILKKTIDTDFVNGLEKIIDSIETSERILKYNTVINDILISSNIPKYVQIGKKLLTMREKILDELNYEYKSSVELIREWKQIIEFADDMEFEQIKPM